MNGGFALEWATMRVLAQRDLVRFFRQPSRVIGALAQPVLFWVVIGGGFAGSFALPGASHVDYRAYFFPGVVAMVLLFSAIFATISVIEDRREGFLQAVLAGPASRASVLLGKALGSSGIALLQAGLFLLLAPLAGISIAEVSFALLAAVMVLTSLALTGMGLALAWWVRSSAGYHAVMSLVMIPMWILSGGLFPVKGTGPVLSTLMALNPMRFAVEGLRRALYGAELAVAVGGGASLTGLREVLALAAFAATFLVLAAISVRRSGE